MIVHVLSWLFIAAGAGFVMVGGLGLIRMPDLFTRLHATSVADTVGAGFMLTGFMLQAGFSLAALKLVLILVFLLITGPTAAHALAHAALLDGHAPQAGKNGDPGP